MAKQVHRRFGLEDIDARAQKLEKVLEKVKYLTLKPTFEKTAPRFSQALVGEILGLSKSQMLYRLSERKFVGGTKVGTRTLYSIEDVRNFARADGRRHAYAEGHGICLTIANFKGGVGKSSTAVTLAQYLSLRGLDVCIVDMDPQASSTTLFGVSPYLDVGTHDSSYGFFGEDDLDVVTLARPTYWPGIDLIAASQELYGCEFILAAEAPALAGKVFSYLSKLIPPLRQKYDVILIDTQPSLGFLTSNAIFAADHLLVTVPPSNLDFASSVMFWSLLRDLMDSANGAKGELKLWEDVSVLQTRVDEQDRSTETVRRLMSAGYGDWLLPHVIPATRVATTASSEFATVYDIEKYEGSHRSIKRAREAFDKAYQQILTSLERTWDVWQHPENFDVLLPSVETPSLVAVSDSAVGAATETHLEAIAS